jgi:6-pyruvoyltetrahydropterin/6-carboxytetrahydropterin synthase
VDAISISVAAHNRIFILQNSGICQPSQPLPLLFVVYPEHMKQRVAVIRREHFNAAHRLYRKDWTDEQNSKTFGKCSLPNYHGHNYELEVKVVGDIDEATGYVMDLKLLSDLVNDQVLEKFDHRNLNVDVEEFRTVIPTAENIAVVIYNLLRPHIAEQNELFIRLFETPRNYVEYPVQ